MPHSRWLSMLLHIIIIIIWQLFTSDQFLSLPFPHIYTAYLLLCRASYLALPTDKIRHINVTTASSLSPSSVCCRFVCLTGWLSVVSMSICQSVHLYVCLSVCRICLAVSCVRSMYGSCVQDLQNTVDSRVSNQLTD